MKKLKYAVALVVASIALTACSPAAQVGSENLSKAADNFELDRRVVFVNGITDKYLLEIQGRCSITDEGGQLEVVCKVGEAPNGDDLLKKHFLGLSDNVTYFIEQLEPAAADTYHYRVIFRPETIVPDIDLQTSGEN